MAVVGVLALVLIATPGCVSSKMFKSNVEDTDSRVTAVENAVESTEKRIDDLKSETDRRIEATRQKADQAATVGNQALSKAESAEKAAQGKLLWTVTLTDDKVKFEFGKTELDSGALWTVTLTDDKVKFEFGKTELDSGAISLLDDLAAKVKSYGKALYLEVEGHTDNVGDENYNLSLAHKRADAVRNYLNQNGGIPLHAMNTIAFGESKPIADNSSKEGRAQNRRVVVRVLE
jgi:outer membrane protein OmpA-like peptidoglycan-associated protein